MPAPAHATAVVTQAGRQQPAFGRVVRATCGGASHSIPFIVVHPLFLTACCRCRLLLLLPLPFILLRPCYRTAPEVLTSQSFTYASDIFAYGVFMFEVFAEGDFPFDEIADVTFVDFLVRDTDPIAPHLSAHSMLGPYPAIQDLFKRCLSRAADDRPTAAEVAKAIDPQRWHVLCRGSGHVRLAAQEKLRYNGYLQVGEEGNEPFAAVAPTKLGGAPSAVATIIPFEEPANTQGKQASASTGAPHASKRRGWSMLFASASYRLIHTLPATSVQAGHSASACEHCTSFHIGNG